MKIYLLFLSNQPLHTENWSGMLCPRKPNTGRQSAGNGILSCIAEVCTDIDYADDVALLVDKKESFRAALVSMDEEASKFGLRVSWTKTKIQNLGSGPTPSPIIVDGNTFDAVEEFTWQYTVE